MNIYVTQLDRKNMEFYTVFYKGKLWTNVIDDMNSEKDFSMGGLLWFKKDMAKQFIKNIITYDEFKNRKDWKIVKLKL